MRPVGFEFWGNIVKLGLLQNMQSCMGNVVAVDENVMYREKGSDRVNCVSSVFLLELKHVCDPDSHCKHYRCVGGNIYIHIFIKKNL